MSMLCKTILLPVSRIAFPSWVLSKSLIQLQCHPSLMWALVSMVTKIKILAEYLYQLETGESKVQKTEELICEWRKFKYSILKLKSEMPADVVKPLKNKELTSQTPTDWLLHHMLSNQSTYSHFVPELLCLAEVCMSLPVSNTWPERGASAVKRLKNKAEKLSERWYLGITNAHYNQWTRSKSVKAWSRKQWKSGMKWKLVEKLLSQTLQVPLPVTAQQFLMLLSKSPWEMGLELKIWRKKLIQFSAPLNFPISRIWMTLTLTMTQTLGQIQTEQLQVSFNFQNGQQS